MARTQIFSLMTLTCLMATHSLAQSESPSFEHLKELSVFVGEWKSTTKLPPGTPPSEKLGPLAGRVLNLTQTFHWAPGKAAMVADYRYELEDERPILATTLMGWDQNRQEIRSYEFTTEKGVWSAVWKREGDIWVSSFEGTDLDGAKHTGKRTFEFTDPDHCIVRDVELTKEGQSVPDAESHFVRQTQKVKDAKRDQMLARYEKEFLGRWLSRSKLTEAIPGFADAGDEVITLIELKSICPGLYAADAHNICKDKVGMRKHFTFGWDSIGQQIQGHWFDETGASGYINYRFDGKKWSGDSCTVSPDGTEVKSEFDLEVTEKAHRYLPRNAPPGPEDAGEFLRQ